MGLSTENALRNEVRPWGRGRRSGWVFPCKKCGTEMWVLPEYLLTRGDFCKSCTSSLHCKEHLSRKKRPFESLYNSGLLRRAKISGISVSLTYEEFLEFTTVNECHYCGGFIPWISHGRQSPSHGYHLDRKDNRRGYAADNLVVACAICNRIKNAHFSYEEMMRLAPHIRAIRLDREGKNDYVHTGTPVRA
jgi:hypothetical protein